MDMPRLFSLSGRTAIVTGAARGIGLAFATGLAEAGATVLLTDRLGDIAENEAEKLRARGLAAEASPLDVADHDQIARTVEAFAQRHGRLDIAIGNAGIGHNAPIEDYELADWDRVLTVNLRSCFLLAKAATVPMKKQRSGRLIFTSSINTALARPIHAYVASKSGVSGLTKSLANELGDFNITCNAIAPGFIATEMTARSRQDEQHVERIARRTALRRWGTPDDLAGAAVFLASDAASFVTGQTIFVDGGMSATLTY